MAELSTRFNFGKVDQGDTDQLMRVLMDLYEKLANAINEKPKIVVQSRSPTSADYLFDADTLWAYPGGPEIWILTDVSGATATWTQLV